MLGVQSGVNFTSSPSTDSQFEIGLTGRIFLGEETRFLTPVGEAIRFLMRVENCGVDTASGRRLLVIFGRGGESSLLRFVALEISKSAVS